MFFQSGGSLLASRTRSSSHSDLTSLSAHHSQQHSRLQSPGATPKRASNAESLFDDCRAASSSSQSFTAGQHVAGGLHGHVIDILRAAVKRPSQLSHPQTPSQPPVLGLGWAALPPRTIRTAAAAAETSAVGGHLTVEGHHDKLDAAGDVLEVGMSVATGDLLGAAAKVACAGAGGALITYLVDGSCPICKTLQMTLERFAGRDSLIQFADLAADEGTAESILERFGVERESAMLSIHIIKSGGEVVKGFPAFMTLLGTLDPTGHSALWAAGLMGSKLAGTGVAAAAGAAGAVSGLGLLPLLLPMLSLFYTVVSKYRHQLAPAWAAFLQSTHIDEAILGRSVLAELTPVRVVVSS